MPKRPRPPVRADDVRRVALAGSMFLSAARRTRRRTKAGENWRSAVAAELRDSFETLGPTYVKLGQMVASTPGLFPDFLVQGMQGCLDEVAPLAVAQVHQVVAEELGAPPAEVFAAFDDRPLASASIGQVHCATTLDGADVVVKVQRPDIRDRITTDLRILAALARGAERSSKRVRLTQPAAIVDDFASTLAAELSFMVEARSMEAVTAALADFPEAHRIHIPAVDWRHTTPRVLTMERVDGTRLDDVDALVAQGVDPADLLKTAVRGWLHGTLVHGVFHGDLHAGNLLVDRQGRATFLDFGICGRLDDAARAALFAALPAVLGRDFPSLAAALFTTPDGEPEPDLPAITADLERALVPVLDAPLGEVSYAQAFVEVVRVGLRHGVLLPNELILVFKQFFYVERFTRALAPDWQPLNDPDLLRQVLAATRASAA
jgi:predicted unusual protein kinase regulating ubiquinone biosynthesis (AarF/ABC1/UbiB family)